MGPALLANVVALACRRESLFLVSSFMRPRQIGLLYDVKHVNASVERSRQIEIRLLILPLLFLPVVKQLQVHYHDQASSYLHVAQESQYRSQSES